MSTPTLSQSNIDQRREPRVPVVWPGRIDLGGGQSMEVRVRDISESGVGLRCDRPIPIDSRLNVTLGVPDLNDPKRLQAVPGALRVMFVVMAGDEWRVGCQWLELSPAGRALMQQWLQRTRFG
jgi:hypothetical protein